MTSVLVLGASGMLGAMVADVLERNPDLDVTRAARGSDPGASIRFDAVSDSVDDVAASGYDWIVNAIGVIKPRIDERDPGSVARAIEVNAAFPHRLAAALQPGQRMIGIATDGVFSGASGPYNEGAPHDSADVYGRTKSLGEASAPGCVHLRCSVIGPEPGDPPVSLLGWVLSQPRGASIAGYTNNRWNGVTTWHFGKLCDAAITAGLDELPSPLHVVPADSVSKAELLELVLHSFGRRDVTVSRTPADAAIDRTLTTRHPDANRRLWAAAGYEQPPTVATMVAELAAGVMETARTPQ